MSSPYQKLASPEEQIRVLELIAGSEETPIICKTTVALLSESPPYTALSYCWGNEQEPYEWSITFNEVTNFGVTRNLFDALQALRKQERSTKLWVDALCINQKDTQEKNVQVKLMGEIYRKADETCIWLGEAADDSDVAMDAIAGLDGEDLDSPRNQLNPATLAAIEKLQKRPWWSRVWVIQEAILSPKPMVRCGNKVLAIDDFVRLDNIRRTWHQSSGKYVQTRNPISTVSFALRNPFTDILTFWDDSRGRVIEGKSTLSEWAHYLSDFKATDLRDKIYGLLGLGNDADRRTMQVAYEKEMKVNVVYTRAAAWFLQTERDLIYFQFDQDNKAGQLVVDGEELLLPSWVPDFSESPPKPDDKNWFRPLYVPLTGGYRPYGDETLLSKRIQPPNPFPPGQSEKLAAPHLRGLLVDTIAFSSGCPHIEFYRGTDPKERMAYRIRRMRASVQRILEWEAVADKARPAGPYELGRAQSDAFRLTLLANRGPDWSKLEPHADEERRNFFEIFLGRADLPGEPGSQLEATTPDEEDERKLKYFESMIRVVVQGTAGRSFIITSQGYFGLAPLNAKPDDIVCVLEGGGVPFVMRRVPEKDLSDHNITPAKDQVFCNLVGESYVHGVSDGEWIAGRTQDKVLEFIVC